MPSLRTLLVLGRVSNLPTVWSNCLAGWWLGGAKNTTELPLLFAGVTFLYVGGMFLNDAFDVEFDRQHRKERPIPSGAISAREVWRAGFALLIAGEGLLLFAGKVPGILGIALTLCILLYDAIHKLITFSPLLMGVCRFLVYVIAAAIGIGGVTGEVLWCGLALGAYVTGLSFVARGESLRGPLKYWPIALLGIPVGLAILLNTGRYRETALLLSLIFALWVLRCLRPTYWTNAPNPGRTVSGLLAGIVFVDWLAVADAPHRLGLVFIALFISAISFQRFAPAT